jgi:hypothetical protein
LLASAAAGGVESLATRSERSDIEPVVAVVARSDASEWENIVEYDRDAG